MDTAVLQRSLAIMESMVLNSQDLYQKVAQEITIGQLIPHLQGYGQLIALCKCSYQINEKIERKFLNISVILF